MKRTRLLLIAPVLPAGLIVICAGWLVTSGSPGNVDFYWRRAKYESIVAHAKALPLAPGAQTQTTLEGFKVDIELNSRGAYTLTITTRDLHHAGVYGYVFSDATLAAHPNANYPELPAVDNPGNMPFADKRILGQQGHWWSVYNDLD